jgi:endogenous inhibitor of DNA gyrase (YacG/DUF329 family)
MLEIKCPRCGKKSLWQDNPSRPFCSDKCRLLDLGRWADEEYRLAGERAPQQEDETPGF